MPADVEAQRYAEAVETFETALGEFIAPEMSDAEIGRAFHEALTAWRRADLDHLRERADEQRRQAALRVEAFLQTAPPQGDEPPTEPLPPIMADPPWVFERSRAEGGRAMGTKAAQPTEDAPQIAQDGPGGPSDPNERETWP